MEKNVLALNLRADFPSQLLHYYIIYSKDYVTIMLHSGNRKVLICVLLSVLLFFVCIVSCAAVPALVGLSGSDGDDGSVLCRKLPNPLKWEKRRGFVRNLRQWEKRREEISRLI